MRSDGGLRQILFDNSLSKEELGVLFIFFFLEYPFVYQDLVVENMNDIVQW